jgi:ABC-type polysaccharide/polyol phosphate export permease
MYMIVLYYVFPVNIIVEIIRNIVELNPFFHNNYLSKEMMYGVSWECQI